MKKEHFILKHRNILFKIGYGLISMFFIFIFVILVMLGSKVTKQENVIAVILTGVHGTLFFVLQRLENFYDGELK